MADHRLGSRLKKKLLGSFLFLLQFGNRKTRLFRGLLPTLLMPGRFQLRLLEVLRDFLDSIVLEHAIFSRTKIAWIVTMSSFDSTRPLIDVDLLSHPQLASFDHVTPLLVLTRILLELLQVVKIYFEANPSLTCSCSSLLPSLDLLLEVRNALAPLRDRRERLAADQLVSVGRYINAVHHRIREVLRVHFTTDFS